MLNTPQSKRIQLTQIVFACFFTQNQLAFLIFPVNKLKNLNILPLLSFYRKIILIFAKKYAAISENRKKVGR